MNRPATKAKFKEMLINRAEWCRRKGFAYQRVHTLLTNQTKLHYTLKQMEIIEELKRDGLYVPGEDEKQQAQGCETEEEGS